MFFLSDIYSIHRFFPHYEINGIVHSALSLNYIEVIKFIIIKFMNNKQIIKFRKFNRI